MILIRRLISVIGIVFLGVFMSACTLTESTPAPPKLELSSALADVTYKGIGTSITLTNNTVCTEVSADGITYTFDGTGCRISLGELSVKSDRNDLSSNALPQILFGILKDAAEENALSSAITSDKEAEYTGELNGIKYTLTCDRQRGELHRIESKTMGLELSFQKQPC